MVSRTEEVRPSDTDNFDLPEAPEGAMFETLEQTLRAAIQPSVPDSDQGEPDEDEPFDDELEEDEEPDELADEGEPDDTEPADEGKPEGRSVDDWVNILRTDGVQRLSEIPRKLHKDVLPAYVESEKRQVADDLGMVAQAQVIAAIRNVAFIYNLDQHFAADPDAKLDWLEGGSQDAQIYQQWKQIVAKAQQQDDASIRQRNEQAQTLVSMQRKQYDRLAPYPELQAEIQQRYQTGAYPANMQGLERLTDDVMELLAKGVEESVSKRSAPAKKKVQARKDSADTRRSVPRPDVSRGRISAASDRRDNMSADDLIALGVSRQLQNVRR